MACVFCEIVAGRAPASVVHEDDAVIAFMGIQPSAPGECLVIPKAHVDHFTDVPDALAARVMVVAQHVGRRMRREFGPQRVGYVVHGYGVAHAHLILVPQHGPYHVTSDRFARVADGRVAFDMSGVPFADRTTLDEHARLLRPSPASAPAVLVAVGASGAGKSTLVGALAALAPPGVGCYHFDSIGVPSPEEIAARFGDGAGFQAWALDEWAARLARNDDGVRVAVLDAQVTPRAACEALARHGLRGGVVLVDCGFEERNARLRGPRGQPELATPQMDGWAAYLRGQADALDVPVLDTTGATPEAGVEALRRHVEALADATVARPAAGAP